MNITLFTRPKSVLTVGLALLLAFDPNLIFQWTGLVLGDAGTLLGRILGLVYLGIAIELWFVRSNSELVSFSVTPAEGGASGFVIAVAVR